MTAGDVIGLACIVAFGAFVFWFGLRQQRRAAVPLKARSLAALAGRLGPAVAEGATPPAGRWHRVLQASHSSATLRDGGPVVLFSELVVVDQDGQHWHCKLQCDEQAGVREPVLTPLASSTFTFTWRP